MRGVIVRFSLLVLVSVVGGCGERSSSAGAGEPARDRSCRTACDCDPGLSCHAGQCLSGTIAMFCCDACPPEAPAQQQCEHRDGRTSVCAELRRHHEGGSRPVRAR
jgi:hypothetical protein